MASSPSGCSIEVEDTFGPSVAVSCLNGFDFTLLFEESILTILPLAIAISWTFLRLFLLRTSSVKTRVSPLLWTKGLVYATYLALYIALLALWSAPGRSRTRTTSATLGLTLAAYVFFALLSFAEHQRSIRPSTPLNVYLAISLLLDLPRARTLFFIEKLDSIPAIFLASFFVKLLLLCLEACEKRSILLPAWQNLSDEATSGILNRSLFIWLNKTFVQGFRNILTVDALAPIDNQLLQASTPDELIKRWEKADKSSEHALIWNFFVHYKWVFLAGLLPRVAYAGFTFAQPFLVERVLDFTTEARSANSNNIGYGLIAAYGITYIGLGLAFAAYQHKTYRLLTMVRGSLIAMIYAKTLRMNSTAFADAEAITLMSADIDRIGFGMELIHEVYMSAIEVGIAIWLLYRILGLAVAAPAVWILVCLLIGLPIAEMAGNAQVPWLEAIEERLAATTSFLGSMKAVKMTGLAEQMSSTLRGLRSSEIRASRRYRILNVGVTLSSFLSSTIAPVWGFGTYILLARAHSTDTLTQGIAFAALSLFELTDQPLLYIVDGVERLQTVINSFRRIQRYLLSEERTDVRLLSSGAKRALSTRSNSSNEDDGSLSEKTTGLLQVKALDPDMAALLQDVSTRYSPHQKLDDSDEEGDEKTEDATSESNGSHTPKQILTGVNLEILRSQTTMIVGPVGCGKSTLLRLLLGEMPHVSGLIQTSFTTAAYCPQTPWISWGTVQANILGPHLWDQNWYSQVVHACELSADFRDWPEGDQTKTGTRGSRLSGGQQMRVSLARAIYARESVYILDDVLTGLDRRTEGKILQNVFGPHGLLKKAGATVILATNSTNHLAYADNIVILSDSGSVEQTGALDDLRKSSAYIQRLAEHAPSSTSRPILELSGETLEEIGPLDIEEKEGGSERQTGDIQVYLYYIKMAGWGFMLLYLFCMSVFVFGVQFPTVWLQMWTNANETEPNANVGYWLGVYGALAGLVLLGCSSTDAVFNLIIVPRTMWTMHDNLLVTTVRAATSYLTSTDAGKTTNRFSQDLQLIDNDLPRTLDRTLYQFLTAIVAAILIFVASGYVAAAVPGVIAVLYIIQYYYLRTSRQLRLLDIEAKAPLFSNFIETIGGLASIRAQGWSEYYSAKNLERLNRSQKPYYLLWCLQRWLALVLDLLVAGIAILLVGIATNVQNGQTGYLGTALYSVVSFSITLQNLVIEWTQLELSLGAISRVRTYVLATAPEDSGDKDVEEPEGWPKDGSVEIKGVSASYDASSEPVLKDVSFTVKSGEKVAICGRSGSGKSSLISALLRMLDLSSGSIHVSGQDISILSRQSVRRKLNTLPQEPFFLAGDVRTNLDPLGLAEDEDLLGALSQVGLAGVVTSLDDELHAEILSHGQRQLFCLARALVRPSELLIMDEATSSVDADSQELMQKIIRQEFEGKTVLVVAHKLDSIIDFDKVVLLEAGRVVEMGRPSELLETRDSKFKALYESHMAEA